jgi:aminomethyltransferase
MNVTTQLARTPLTDWHVAHHGRMVDFAGWSMPVQYTSIVEEHLATRQRVGMFDISHMGRLKVTGPDAARFLDCLLSRQVADMRPGQIRYALICDATGGTLDDVLVYFLEKSEQGPEFWLVVNASNRVKIVDWLKDRVIEFQARVADNTTCTAMIAVQGPRAVALVDSFSNGALGKVKNYRGTTGRFCDQPCYLSRTGYTGEDGGEIICDTTVATEIWETLFVQGRDEGLQACGLGARDTLRLEAAMPLYGHELSENINPIQAGLEFAVTFGERDFIGREAIEESLGDETLPQRVGLQLDGKRVAREGSPIKYEGQEVGEVTSGTFSPTLEKPIAMGYVAPSIAHANPPLSIEIRGKSYPASIVSLPFYRRPG